MHSEHICVPNGRKSGYVVTSFAKNMVVFILDFLYMFWLLNFAKSIVCTELLLVAIEPDCRISLINGKKTEN